MYYMDVIGDHLWYVDFLFERINRDTHGTKNTLESLIVFHYEQVC